MKAEITCPSCSTGLTLFRGEVLANRCLEIRAACMCPICASTFTVTIRIERELTVVNYEETEEAIEGE
jgi:transcriptional regulator NrdR family protein